MQIVHSIIITSVIFSYKYSQCNAYLLKFYVNVQDVILIKEGSLGFSIIGGTDHSCTPFGSKEPGIFISHVRIRGDFGDRTKYFQTGTKCTNTKLLPIAEHSKEMFF